MRGLKTLKLRMEKATENAHAIVKYLKNSPAVKEVLYTGKGGMISFKVVEEEKFLTSSITFKSLPLQKVLVVWRR